MENDEQEFSLKNFFIPLTNAKAIHLIIIIGFVVYFWIFINGFVWDDLTYIISNPEIKTFNLVTLIGPNTFNSSGYFRPLSAIYFSLLYNIFGNTAFFYHFIQLCLHLMVVIMFYFIYKHFFKPEMALILCLIFLIHPINVESVAYIGASQSQLYMLLGGLAFYLSLKDVLSNRFVLSIHILLLFALLTKEVSILFFLFIYLFRFIYKKKLSILFFISSFLSLIVYIAIRISVLGAVLNKMHLIPISEISLSARLSHIPIIFFYYLKTFLYPKTLAINQIWTIPYINWQTFYFPLIVDLGFLALIGGVLFYLVRKISNDFKIFMFFLIWFLGGMSLLLQIFPLDMTVADRWFYLPMFGLLGLIGLGINYILPKIIRYKNTVLVIFIAILLLLSARTIARNNNWRNALTLYSHDVQEYDNYDLENNLGAELAFTGRFDLALPHFLKSTDLLPHDTNLYNIGSVYEHLKDYEKAKEYYQKALEVKNAHLSHQEIRKRATEGLGKMLLLHDQPDTANKFLKNAVMEFPDSGTFWSFLAISEYNLNHHDRALIAAEKAKILLPNASTGKLYNLILNNQKIDLRLD